MNLVWTHHHVSQEMRSKKLMQKPFVLWFTGLSGSGKSTLAGKLELCLYDLGYKTYLLDGDNVRQGLNSDLDFSVKGRVENIRRIGELTKLFFDAGLVVFSAFISPFEKDRQTVRSLFKEGEFIEVYLSASYEECEKRDVKGLYQKAKCGEVKDFTGRDSIYEEPVKAELSLNTSELSVDETIDAILDYLTNKNLIDFHRSS